MSDLYDPQISTALHERVDGLSPDLASLAAGAVRQGTRLRRRRTATTVAAAFAVVGVVGGTAATATLLAEDTSAPREPQFAATTPAPQTEPITTRALTAALLEQVQARVTGTATDFTGQDDTLIAGPANLAPEYLEANGSFTFSPDATGDPGFVSLGLQVTSPVPLREFQCDRMGATGQHDGEITACERRVLADGTVVLLVEERLRQADGSVLIDRSADSFHPDGFRVTARSTNTDEESDNLKGDQTYTTHGDAGLSLDDLAAVVGWEVWGPELPVRYTAAGAGLSPFDNLSQKPNDLCGDQQQLVDGRCEDTGTGGS